MHDKEPALGSRLKDAHCSLLTCGMLLVCQQAWVVTDLLEHCQRCQGRASLVEGCSHSLAGEEFLQAAGMCGQSLNLAVLMKHGK